MPNPHPAVTTPAAPPVGQQPQLRTKWLFGGFVLLVIVIGMVILKIWQPGHAGEILFPTQGKVVTSDTETEVQAKVFLANAYAAAVICARDVCFVQNSGRSVTPSTTFSIPVRYSGPDTYQVYLGITQDPDLFERGSKLDALPLTDSKDRPVYWVGPVEVTRR